LKLKISRQQRRFAFECWYVENLLTAFEISPPGIWR